MTERSFFGAIFDRNTAVRNPTGTPSRIAPHVPYTLVRAIIFGAPTYMGSTPWQFKKFADASSKAWFTREWQDKIFGGFTVSASVNGDKQMTLLQMQTLAAQHGGIWVSLGLAPASTSAATRADVNHLGGSLGLIVQCPADAGAEAIPAGDMETARLYGERVKTIASRFK